MMAADNQEAVSAGGGLRSGHMTDLGRVWVRSKLEKLVNQTLLQLSILLVSYS